MRDYGKVHSSFWSSATTRGLSDDGRMLAMYLMTSPHTTIAGVFRLPDGYACEDLQWQPARVSKGFAELFAKGFANRCETTKWVWINKHLIWNPPENPNQRKAAVKVAHSVPDECSWKPAFMRACVDMIGIEYDEGPNPCRTLAEPLLNQKQEQEQNKEHVSDESDDPVLNHAKEQKQHVSSDGQPGFQKFWSCWPSSARKVAKAECAKRWKNRGLEEHAGEIVQHVEAMGNSKQWVAGFEPAPLTYLNQRRWEDGNDDRESNGSAFAGVL